MPSGGKRPGAGRPAGAVTRKTREIADWAAESGMLPHELLLAVVRGEMVGGVTPTFEQRLDAAKAAAPYFAPKLAAVDVTSTGTLTVYDVSDEPLTPEEWAREFVTEH